MPAWALKGGAVCLTVLAAVGSAAYAGGHVRDRSAPLRPSLEPQVTLTQSVRATTAQAVTETHES